MNWMGRICSAIIAAALALAGAACAAPSPAPKLVVVIAVDQFGLELFQRYRPTFTGGLKQLSEGLVYTGYQSHAATETCPGHSTLLTGMHPSRTGIVANSWYDRAMASTVYCVSVEGVADPSAKGSAKLRVDTLGDWLNRARPAARSIAVAGKDRSAIMMAGHHPDAVYWWEDGRGFDTSGYAGPATRSVLAPARAFNRRRFAAWRKQPPQLWPQTPPPRCAALQRPYRFGDIALSGRVPPDAAQRGRLGPRNPDFADQLLVSPTLDRMTLEFAGDLVRHFRLGQRRETDLLAISLSGTDMIGHRYGSGGAEMCVQLNALDAALGSFFAELDRRKISYVVVLTADHGGIDAAERRGPPARRVDARGLLADLSKHLRTTFGLAYDPLEGAYRQLVINLGPADEPRRPAIAAAALTWLRARPEVADAFLGSDIAKVQVAPGKPPPELTTEERFAESYDPERSGDILVAYAEGSTVGAPRAPGDAVAGHGSPWDYDRKVPIVFWWPGVTAKHETLPIETVDIAPTLAPLLRITPPPVDGRCVEIGQGCPK